MIPDYEKIYLKEIEKRDPKYHHTKCHDCGRYMKKDRWVPKDHRWKKHGLCWKCVSNYDDPTCY